MKGSVHAAIGASAPAGLIVTQHVSLFQGFTMAAVASGFSLLPDLDTGKALASKALGTPVHRAVHWLSRTAMDRTATGPDRANMSWMKIRKRDPYHRGVTHTLVAAAVVSAVAYLSFWVHPVAVGLLGALAVFTLWPLYRKTVPLVVLASLSAGVGSALLLDPWLFALAAGGGYLSHIAADGCTTSGVPALWPMKINGKRWWKICLLGRLVPSGSEAEKGPALGIAVAANGLLVFLTL